MLYEVITDFNAPAVMEDNTINENFSLKEYLNGSYGVVFFYPLDFTFVCPSEIIAHHNRITSYNVCYTKLLRYVKRVLHEELSLLKL